jgi:hypothetical protein
MFPIVQPADVMPGPITQDRLQWPRSLPRRSRGRRPSALMGDRDNLSGWPPWPTPGKSPSVQVQIRFALSSPSPGSDCGVNTPAGADFINAPRPSGKGTSLFSPPSPVATDDARNSRWPSCDLMAACKRPRPPARGRCLPIRSGIEHQINSFQHCRAPDDEFDPMPPRATPVAQPVHRTIRGNDDLHLVTGRASSAAMTQHGTNPAR